ncbi:MAG TPA: lipopolysaccharide assembly protein LapA domain-containing protein [Mycobacteriales bacterium]|nr:lipopolysaccharide assembly protein LapA domain-containing protein [Mycobacteriales bacterium]
MTNRPPDPGAPTGTFADAARTGRIWSVAVLFLVVLIPLVIFLAQNTGVRVSFLTLHLRIPLGVAMLISTVGGALLVWLVALARTWQLRRTRSRR